jgi:hypothetical protein
MYAHGLLELFDDPVIAPLGQIHGKITVKTATDTADKEHIEIKWHLPEGFTVECRKNVMMNAKNDATQHGVAEFTITAGETVDANNDVLVEVKSQHRPTGMYFPIHIVG